MPFDSEWALVVWVLTVGSRCYCLCGNEVWNTNNLDLLHRQFMLFMFAMSSTLFISLSVCMLEFL